MATLNLVRIVTTAGTTYYNPADPVLTKAGSSPDGRQVYILQPASQLQPGQRVAWDKRYVNATLDQIADSLTTEPTYAAAQDAIFLKNKQGQLIPRFREFLIKGLYGLAIRDGRGELEFLTKMDENRLGAKIHKDAPDFSPVEYGAMAREVHKYVAAYHEAEGLPLVTEAAVRKWLNGETIGPRDNSIFKGLGELNPEFRAYTESRQGVRNLWDQYKIWVVVRQGLRNYFASVKANAASASKVSQERSKPDNGDETISEGSRHIALTPFLKHVLDRFYQEVSNQHVNVLVTGIEQVSVHPNTEGRSLEEVLTEREKGVSEPHLYRGLCKERPTGLDAFVVPKSSVIMANLLTADAIDFGLRRYFRQVPSVRRQVEEIARDFGVDFKLRPMGSEEDHMFMFLSNYLGNLKANRELVDNQAKEGNKQSEAFRAAGELVLAQVYDGKIDSALGFSSGTFATVLDTAQTINDLFPEAYNKLHRNLMELAQLRDWVKELQESKTQRGRKNVLSRAFDKVLRAGSLYDNEEAKSRGRIEELEAENVNLESSLDPDYRRDKQTLAADAHQFAVKMGVPAEDVLRDGWLMQFLAYGCIKEGRRDDYVTHDEAKRLFASIGLPKKVLDLIPAKVFIDQIKISGAARRAYEAGMRASNAIVPPQPI